MSAGQGSRLPSRVFQGSLTLYRRTLKRVRPLHHALHWVLLKLVIPVFERVRGLHTMPDDPFWFRLELLSKRHEHETIRHIQQRIQPGMVVLDIGAHIGYYTRLCAKLVGPSGRVIAFEPHPRNRDMLTQNIARYSNVTVLPVAAAAEAGTAELYDYLMMSASGSLHYDEALRDVQRAQVSANDIAPRLSNDFQPQAFTVRTATVDACLDELGIARVDVIKMDIEGAEVGALRGMTQTIQASPTLALVMEYNPLGLQGFGHDPRAVIPEVLALGFKQVCAIQPDGSLHDLTNDADAIAHLTDNLTAHMGVVNLLFTKS